MLVRKSRPLKLASSAPFRSRELKGPFLMLTRRTSGATANPGSRLGGLLWRASSIGGETLVDVAGTTGTGFVVMGAFSVSKWPTVAADCVEIGGDCASCEPGNLHFPSASYGHKTRKENGDYQVHKKHNHLLFLRNRPPQTATCTKRTPAHLPNPCQFFVPL